MNLFISPSEEIGKITEKKLFTEQLVTQWPEAIISEINDLNRDFITEWEISIGNKYLSGRLAREEDMFVFEFSDINLGAEFSMWVYKNLLNKNKIILYDGNYSKVLPMDLIVTNLDIILAFS